MTNVYWGTRLGPRYGGVLRCIEGFACLQINGEEQCKLLFSDFLSVSQNPSQNKEY